VNPGIVTLGDDMNFDREFRAMRIVGALLFIVFASSSARADSSHGDALTVEDTTGLLRTFTATGTIDTSGAFFQSLGTNGRTCNTCHRIEDAWTISPTDLQQRFNRTDGTDPVFRTVDGSNSPLADVSSKNARKKAYSMLLSKGVIRIGRPIPANAEFTLDSVDDPYSYASATELSLFRRPLPSTNLRFITAAMWDARETHAPFLPPMDAGVDTEDVVASLRSQAIDAVALHAQGSVVPSDDQINQILNFELGLTTAQVFDNRAGWLNSDDALGGPRALAAQQFYIGINDVLGADPAGADFDPEAMKLFDAWQPAPGDHGGGQRASIARGEALFGNKPIAIAGVGGLNDTLNMPTIAGTCTTCHDAPSAGNHSVALPIDIGVTDLNRRTPDMPLYTLRNIATGAIRQTTDPGRALSTGKWADIGKFKGPILRGLAARAPYFHNGMAASLGDVIDFYNTRFTVGFTKQEKADLVAFLGAL
jgi:cytochrome c peroxidase